VVLEQLAAMAKTDTLLPSLCFWDVVVRAVVVAQLLVAEQAVEVALVAVAAVVVYALPALRLAVAVAMAPLSFGLGKE
jgi:hypothetical protein